MNICLLQEFLKIRAEDRGPTPAMGPEPFIEKLIMRAKFVSQQASGCAGGVNFDP